MSSYMNEGSCTSFRYDCNVVLLFSKNLQSRLQFNLYTNRLTFVKVSQIQSTTYVTVVSLNTYKVNN